MASRFTQHQIEQAIDELEIHKAPLDFRAFATMLSIKLGPDLTFGEIKAALRSRIAARRGERS